MNKIIKIFLLVAVALVGFSACNQDNERAFYEGDSGFSFLQAALVTELSAENNGVFEVTLSRTDASQAATVGVKLIGTSAVQALFALTSPQVTFAAGEYETTAEVAFNLNNLDVGPLYKFDVELIDATIVTKGGNTKTAVTTNRKLVWEYVGLGTFTSNGVYGATYLVEVEKASNSIYRALDLYEDGYNIRIDINASTATAVIAQQEIGLQLFSGYSKTWLRADACTYANGVITVTPGSSSNYNRWIVEPAPSTLGAWVSATEILVLPAGSY